MWVFNCKPVVSGGKERMCSLSFVNFIVIVTFLGAWETIGADTGRVWGTFGWVTTGGDGIFWVLLEVWFNRLTESSGLLSVWFELDDFFL